MRKFTTSSVALNEESLPLLVTLKKASFRFGANQAIAKFKVLLPAIIKAGPFAQEISSCRIQLP